jgi:hypothetical protein
MKKIKINRAPVLTLWAAVVARRLGYDAQEALTLGKVLAGLNAQSKGRRLGIFEENKEKTKPKEIDEEKASDIRPVMIMGRAIPALKTADGWRAAANGKAVDPESVQKYLEQKFGERLSDAQEALETLARSYTPKQLEAEAYSLYEKFRPKIPEGKKGWGIKGDLDLDFIRSLAR